MDNQFEFVLNFVYVVIVPFGWVASGAFLIRCQVVPGETSEAGSVLGVSVTPLNGDTDMSVEIISSNLSGHGSLTFQGVHLFGFYGCISFGHIYVKETTFGYSVHTTGLTVFFGIISVSGDKLKFLSVHTFSTVIPSGTSVACI